MARSDPHGWINVFSRVNCRLASSLTASNTDLRGDTGGNGVFGGVFD